MLYTHRLQDNNEYYQIPNNNTFINPKGITAQNDSILFTIFFHRIRETVNDETRVREDFKLALCSEGFPPPQEPHRNYSSAVSRDP